LHSVFGALKNIKAEVFVVDNNSVDGSVSLVKQKFPQVKLIVNDTNTGFAVANNQAIKLASGKYILLLNPDTVVQEDTFEKTLAFMNADPRAGGLGIKMVDGKGTFLPESKRGLPTPWVAFYKIFGLAKLMPSSKKFGQYHLTFLDKEKTHEVDVLSGAFMLMRKEVLDKIGLLDETFFMYGEDVDLSYRITQAGYKNYYFAGSSIIHYKGESTKKSSVNYVVVFYKAMAIFAKKHFSNKGAGAYIFFIYVAIYLRAFAAIVTRFIKQLFFPAIDFACILLSLYAIKNTYEVNFKLYPNFYSASILNIAFPIYTLIWMFFSYLSGGYDQPLKLKRIIRGVLMGSAFILIVYSLLPEYYRFSRALILLGTVSTSIVYLVLRVIYSVLGIKQFKLNAEAEQKYIAIIGDEEEFNRVSDLLKQTSVHPHFIGFVSNEANGVKNPNYIGNFSQIDEVIEVHKINEVIFCAKNISSQNIINKMLSLVAKHIEFKIAPPESLSIIGSNSIDTAGELYVIDLNNIAKPENKRKKRLLDISISGILFLLFPIVMIFQKRPFHFILNTLRVLFGATTWVGYGSSIRKDLPAIKPSVLTPADEFETQASGEKFNLLLLNYSKEYKPENDLRIIFKAFRKLGS
jgi:GT2 family glycosyltransferase